MYYNTLAANPQLQPMSVYRTEDLCYNYLIRSRFLIQNSVLICDYSLASCMKRERYR